jgi:WD40 repeat protein
MRRALSVLALLLASASAWAAPTVPPAEAGLAGSGLLWRRPALEAPDRVFYRPDGGALFVLDLLGQLAERDPSTLVRRRSLPGGESALGGQAVSRDGRLRAAGDATGSAVMVRDASGKLVRRLPLRDQPTERLEFAANDTLLVGSTATEVWLWRVSDGKPVRPPLALTGEDRLMERATVSPDGSTLAFASLLGGLWLADAAGGKPRRLGTQGAGVAAGEIVFSPDGKLLASADDKGGVYLWDAVAGAKPVKLVCGPYSGPAAETDLAGQPMPVELGSRGVHQMAFSPDGRLLAGACIDGAVRLWDVASRTLIRTLAGHRHMVYAVCFAPDSARLASVDDYGVVMVWDVGQGDLAASLAEHHSSAVAWVAVSVDGKTVVTDGQHRDNAIRLWDRQTGAARGVLCLPEGVESVAAGGKGLYATVSSSCIAVWDTSAQGPPRRFDPTAHHRLPEFGITQISLNLNGDRLAAVVSPARMPPVFFLWDTRSGACLVHQVVPELIRVAFSYDGRLLALYGAKWSSVWDAVTGKSARTVRLSAADGAVQAAGFSADGKALQLVTSGGVADYAAMAASIDPLGYRVRRFEAATGKRLKATAMAPDGRPAEAMALPGEPVLSPDCTRLASANTVMAEVEGLVRSTCTLNVWDTATGKLLTRERTAGHLRDLAFTRDNRSLAMVGDGEIAVLGLK